MTTETFEQMKHILVERFVIDSQKVQLTADLQKELHLDSMDAIDLLFAVNETFNTHIPDRALEHIHTVSQFIDVIEKYKKPDKKSRA